MLLLALPYQSTLAAMIETETVLDMSRGQEARAYLDRIIARQDIQAMFISQGVDPWEAKARINSLSDAEIVRLYDKIEQLPAGGSDFGIVLGTIAFIFIVLIVTDILGYTNVFTFVK
jgi:hypothetical protein